jgi:V/A-type H+-transporting ATPase subunit E
MATQKVTEKILKDAQKEAQEILDNYKKKAAEVKQEYSEKIAAKKKKIEDEVEAIIQAEILRTVSQQRLEFNKQLTLQKYKLINEVSDDALKKLPEHKKYLDFLKALIIKSGTEDGELLMTTHDIKQYKVDVEKFLKGEGLHYLIRAGNDLAGGIIVKKGKTTYLGSLDLIRELTHDELTIAVSRILW